MGATVPDSALDTAWPLPTAKPWPPNHPQRPTSAPVAETRIVFLDADPGDYAETIFWHDARKPARPDADLTVLLAPAA